jgi:hypothetical protein
LIKKKLLRLHFLKRLDFTSDTKIIELRYEFVLIQNINLS